MDLEKAIDLSHPLISDMPVYPGSPSVKISDLCTMNTDGFREKMLKFSTHTGTHLDTPAHMHEHGKTLSDFPISNFLGIACLINCEDCEEINPALSKRQLDNFPKADFLIFNTGWHKKWGTPLYYKNFPTFNSEFLKKICDLNLKGIGMDTPSADSIDSANFANHNILFNKKMLIVENLTNLGLIRTSLFQFICLPLNISDSDGSPVRAIAIPTSYE